MSLIITGNNSQMSDILIRNDRYYRSHSNYICDFFSAGISAKMNRKKQAIFLILLILLDYCHSFPTLHSTLEPLAQEDVQQGILSAQEQEQQRSIIDEDDLAVLTEFLGEHNISLTGNGTSLCADAEENEFYESLKGNTLHSVLEFLLNPRNGLILQKILGEIRQVTGSNFKPSLLLY